MGKTIAALVKKDLLLVQKCSAKVLLVILAVYLAIPLLGHADADNLTMLGSVLCLVCAFLPVSTFSSDEMAKWDRYALSMPVTRDMLVLSKYVSSAVMSLAGMALMAVYLLAICLLKARTLLGIIPGNVLGGLFVSLLMISLLLPCIIRFGTEKGRLVFIVAMLIAWLSNALLNRLPSLAPMGSSWLLGAAVALLAVFLSFQLSLRLYHKKEIS